MYNLDEMIIRIKNLKKKQNLKNDELAEKAGIPKGTLNKILGNETKDPQISNIIKIAQALNVSADYLVFGENEEDTISFTQKEAKLIKAYRKNPHMQNAVDRLLGVQEVEFNADCEIGKEVTRILNMKDEIPKYVK